jgi:[ribosomal protein S5]-alanine N-acetyltransferase
MIDNQIPISTERLLLDRFQREDWRDFYRIESSLEQHLFTAESYKPSTEELTKNYVDELSEVNYGEQENGFILAIRVKESPRLVGFAGFQNGTLQENGQAEVFYSIQKDFWNRGYGTEALLGMLRFGFEALVLHRIVAYCDAENYASRRILEKAHLRLESRFLKDRLRNGEWKDGLGYALLEEEFNALDWIGSR